MAYKVYLDDVKIHDVSEPPHLKCFCTNMVLDLSTDLQINTFSFSMLIDHPQYEDVHVLNSIVSVFDDEEKIFEGRVIRVDKDFECTKTVTCEEVMAYLCDVAAEPFCLQDKTISNHPVISKYDTPLGWMQYFMEDAEWTAYNKLCDESKKIYLGTFNSNRKCSIQTDTPITVFEMLKKIHEECEGYVYITYGKNGKNYLNYVQDFDTRGSQIIEFGKNILDITSYLDGSALYTILYAVGAENPLYYYDDAGNQYKMHDGWIERYHCSFDNGGTRFAKNDTLIKLYGKIYGIKVYDGVNDVATLNQLAQQAVNSQALNTSITVTAADLHLVHADIQKFKIRTYARVISKPHDIDMWMMIKKMHIDMSDPSKTTVTLGATKRTLSERSAGWS